MNIDKRYSLLFMDLKMLGFSKFLLRQFLIFFDNSLSWNVNAPPNTDVIILLILKA